MNKTETAASVILGHIVACPIFALFLLWYNHVLLAVPFGFWQACILSAGVAVVNKTLAMAKHLLALLFAFVMITQCLAWAKVVSLPIIKAPQQQEAGAK